MAKKPTKARRKLIEFDAQTWHALNLLSRESKKTFQELAEEATTSLDRIHQRDEGEREDDGRRAPYHRQYLPLPHGTCRRCDGRLQALAADHVQ
jgi:hypothetical protein